MTATLTAQITPADAFDALMGLFDVAAEEECADCEEAIAEGYSGCGDCCAPDEQWEVTTPSEVREV